MCKRITRWLNQNPLVGTEQAGLKREFPSLFKWRYLPFHVLLLAGLLAAIFPLAFRITLDHALLLAALGGCIFGLKWTVIIRTLLMAAHTVAHDGLSSGMDARQTVVGKWWVVVHQRWYWHVLTALMGTGLAYGLAQYIYEGARHDQCTSPVHFLCYPVLSYAPLYRLPGLSTCILACVITSCFGLLDAGLTVALGLVSALAAQRRHISPRFLSILVFALYVPFVLSVVVEADNYALQRFPVSQNPLAVARGNVRSIQEAAIVSTVASGWVSLADQGVLISANLLRLYKASDFNTLRNLARASIGIGFYLGIIACCLGLAQQLAINLGAPCPPVLLNTRKCLRKYVSENPVVHAQVEALDRYYHQRQWSQAFWAGLFTLALAVAYLPRWWNQIGVDPLDLLPWIAGVVFAAQAAVGLRTLICAAASLSLDAAMPGLDEFEAEARQVMIGRWWAVVHVRWKSHTLVALLRLGLIMGLAQYFWGATLFPPFKGTDRLIMYLASNFGGSGPGYLPEPYWGTWNIVRAAGLLFVFSLADVSLCAAVGLLGGLIVRQRSVFQVGVAALLRMVPPLLGIIFLLSSLTPYEKLDKAFMGATLEDPFVNETRHSLRLLNSLQVAVSTQVDGGVAVVNLMHPEGLPYYGYYGDYYTARQLFSLGAGLGLYGLLTYLVLCLGIKLTRWRGVSRGPYPQNRLSRANCG